MRNEKREIIEIIDGFKNLTYKIKKDNDDIKQSIKNKDATIASCKTEYQKLYAKHKELQERYNELETYILQLQQQEQQQQQQELQQQQQQQKQQNKSKNKKEIYRFTLIIKKGNIIWCLMMIATMMKNRNIQTTIMTKTTTTTNLNILK